MGSGSSDDSLHLAKRGDVVNVTVNHRLNVFGFSHLGDLGGADFAHSGNAGMLDIIAALKWVHDNIERFGGDPKRVLVFGVSGGGMKTAFLMAAPPAKGLLHRACVQSGPGLKMMERDAASRVSEMLLHELGLTTQQLSELKTLPPETLMAARFAVEAKHSGRELYRPDQLCAGNRSRGPAAPPVFSTRRGACRRTSPLLIGSNQTDMVFFMGDDAAAFSLDEAALGIRLERFLGDPLRCSPTGLPQGLSSIFSLRTCTFKSGLTTR